MKSLIFSKPMVKAILAGNKTQTRRPIIPQPVGKDGRWRWKDYEWAADKKHPINAHTFGHIEPSLFKPGDVLYVKETWATFTGGEGTSGYLYKADPAFDNYEPRDSGWKWRSPTFMPQSAARIFLKVTNVTAERLQDISKDDAMKEGFQSTATAFGGCAVYANKYEKALDIECPDGCNCLNSRENFAGLWDSIYAKKPEYKWDKNCWVWVIAFERTETL